jgi:RNA polymerase sigma-70 factor, ECF subfamily
MAHTCERARPADHELVAAARDGAVDAFAVLVDRHHPGLLRHLERQTGDPQLAADLAQEAFLAAFRGLPRLAADPAAAAVSFAAWLHRLAHDRLRRAERRRRLRRLVALGGWRPAPPPRPPRDPLQAALDGLAPDLREALLLHRLAGFAGAEVALIQGTSPAAARRRVCRAAAEFRRRYRAAGGAGADGAAADDL